MPLGRPTPRTCDDAARVTIPAHRRCKPPRRALTTVDVRTRAKDAEADARDAEREAKRARAEARRAAALAKRAGRMVTTRKLTADETGYRKAKTRDPDASTARTPARTASTEKSESLYGKGTLRFAVEDNAIAADTAWRAFPWDPCGGVAFDAFQPDNDDDAARRAAWADRLRGCGMSGLGKLSKRAKAKTRERLKLKDKLVGRRIGTTPPRIEDIDPYAFTTDPCSGTKYSAFRSPFTRKDAYWHQAAGREHAPGKKRVDREQGTLKRLAWQERLHACAMRVYLNRARVSKNVKLRKIAAAHDDASFDPASFAGLRKGKKRCAGAPKKLTKSCSSEAFTKNVRHLVCVAGKSVKQATAIAYNVQRTACAKSKRSR